MSAETEFYFQSFTLACAVLAMGAAASTLWLNIRARGFRDAAEADRAAAQAMRERAREFELQTKDIRDAAIAERAAHQCMHCQRRRKGSHS